MVSAVMPVESEMKKTVRCMDLSPDGWLPAAHHNRCVAHCPGRPALLPADWYAVGAAAGDIGLLVPRAIESGQYQSCAARVAAASRAHSTIRCIAPQETPLNHLVLWLDQLRMTDLGKVGGKNASLGEMIGNLAKLGVSVPGGFATTADAFQSYLEKSGVAERIAARLNGLDVDDVDALVKAGKEIREWVIETPLPAELDQAIRDAYAKLCKDAGADDIAVAVRSSATAEDLPDASFAGQQETFLNVVGIEDVLHKVKEVFASLYNDRAIAYRVHQGFAHENVFLSAGVQLMVRSDVGASGVLFTLDTESGFRDVVFVTGSYGLGEMVVQGAVNPDEFYVFKPTLRDGKPAVLRRNLGAKQLRMVYSSAPGERVKTEPTPAELRHRFCITNEEVEALAKQALIIEQHYGRPMDVEWAKDGHTGKLYIVQARPETVKSRAHATQLERFHLNERGTVLAEGRAIGQKIGAGTARVVRSLADMNKVQPGDVLVADMTDPDWEPVMKRASAIVTNRGGRTCHAAIIARELGVPAVVGTGNGIEPDPRRRGGHRILRRGRYRHHLRRHARLRTQHRRPRRDARGAAQDHDERRQPRACLRLRPAAQRRRRPRPPGNDHRQPHRRASQGAAGIRQAGRRNQGEDRRAHRRLHRPGGVLRRSPRRRHRHHRRAFVPEAGDRAHVATSSRTSTPTSSAARATSRTRRTR
jgi:phosphohistidine swiveling domain-containing protein